jgi:hypothetical protein
MLDTKSMPVWELENTVKALSMLPFLNTQEDTKNLQACQLELKRRSKASKTRTQVNAHKAKQSHLCRLQAHNKNMRSKNMVHDYYK